MDRQVSIEPVVRSFGQATGERNNGSHSNKSFDGSGSGGGGLLGIN